MDNNAVTPRRSGGLYARVNMSVKSANIMVISLLTLLIIASVFIVKHSGFTIKFDTDGGSHIESVKAMYSDTLSPETPVTEGFSFTGWYTDRDCTQRWEPETEPITGSMTLYAGWEKAD